VDPGSGSGEDPRTAEPPRAPGRGSITVDIIVPGEAPRPVTFVVSTNENLTDKDKQAQYEADVKNYPGYDVVPGTASGRVNCVGWVVKNKWPELGGNIYETAPDFFNKVIKPYATRVNKPNKGDIGVFHSKPATGDHVVLVLENANDQNSVYIESKDNQESVIRGRWSGGATTTQQLWGNPDPIEQKYGEAPPTFYRMKPGVSLSPRR